MPNATEVLLIPEPDTEQEHLELEGLPGHEAESEFTKLNLFLWILTLSAGISGLLFGYEYVCSGSNSSRSHHAELPSQHRGHLRHADPYRVRSIKPTLDHLRQKPDSIMY